MHEIQLEPIGEVIGCGPDETILDAALRQGFNLVYGCREGQCSACKGVLYGDLRQEYALVTTVLDALSAPVSADRPKRESQGSGGLGVLLTVEDCVDRGSARGDHGSELV